MENKTNEELVTSYKQYQKIYNRTSTGYTFLNKIRIEMVKRGLISMDSQGNTTEINY